jgi:hypothetical protein
MSNATKLTRTQRRLMLTHSARVDAVSQADRRYFERLNRSYRLRLASPAEIEQELILNNSVARPLPGYTHFVAVKNVAPGVRLRLFFRGPETLDWETASEGTARAIWTSVATERARQVEACLRQATNGGAA